MIKYVWVGRYCAVPFFGTKVIIIIVQIIMTCNKRLIKETFHLIYTVDVI